MFISSRKDLILSSTFTYRFQKDLGFHFKSREELEKIKKTYLYNNVEADSLTKSILAKEPDQKKFVYTHLMLPHHPYFFDSTGKANPPEDLEDSSKLNKNLFISYLVYSNKKILEFIDRIKSTSKRQPIIILMSDHGFRQLPSNTNPSYYFMNLNAVFFPDKNYSGFYNEMSNVNQFRVILNTEFKQKFLLLKDSSVFLWEK